MLTAYKPKYYGCLIDPIHLLILITSDRIDKPNQSIRRIELGLRSITWTKTDS